MSRKHNTKHARSKSRYPLRLKARGVTSAGARMLDLETLRKRRHSWLFYHHDGRVSPQR